MKNITYNANLDKYGYPVDAPITQGTIPPSVVPWQLGIEQRLQQKRIISSQVTIKSFQQQLSGNYAFGTVGNGGTLYLTSTITPAAPHSREPMYAIPYAGIYLGTNISANGQIYPSLGTAAGTAFPLQAGLDFQTFDGTVPEWKGYVINNSGASATVGFNILWQYLWFNSGTAS